MAEARVERRLAAILAADVAGYSRLMGIGEEATLAALKACRRELIDPKIAEYRGRIVKTTGDGALVEFPSAVDAVRCAIEIQRAMAARNATIPEDRRIEFRIGINVGDIIIDEGDIYGDGVNIAARVESLASPGEICLSDNAYQQIKGKLAFDVSDLGEQHLKNIAQPVRVYGVRLDGTPERPALVLPDKPSIAVLPFLNMSGDPEQEYFADGISEDIITGLSKLRWFFVIARNSSFTYKGKAVDVKRVSRELGVRYVLEGSVRKGGNRVRITSQLIDATTGNHLWAERYDGELTDIFTLQDEITKKVVAAIEPKLLEAEGIRSQSRSSEDLGAWEMVIHANSLFWRLTKTESLAAIATLKQVVERHSEYAPAHSMLAFSLLLARQFGWISMEPQVKQAEALAIRAA
jgi:adenylate cyclase